MFVCVSLSHTGNNGVWAALTRKDWHSSSVSILCSDIRRVQVEKESLSVLFRAFIVLRNTQTDRQTERETERQTGCYH